jgi:hypothetical protein
MVDEHIAPPADAPPRTLDPPGPPQGPRCRSAKLTPKPLGLRKVAPATAVDTPGALGRAVEVARIRVVGPCSSGLRGVSNPCSRERR